MEETKQLSDNEIIAKFMGAKLGNGGTKKYPVYTGVPVKSGCITQTWTFSSKDFLYHNSWDWLMPVVQKIASLKYDVHIHTFEATNMCGIDTWNGETIVYQQKPTILEATYNAVVSFIKWYSNQPQKAS